MERKVHKQALGEEERQSKISLNKINVQRFKDTTARGFDIMTNKEYNSQTDQGSKQLHEPQVKAPPSTWTKIKNTSNAFDEFAREPSSHDQSVHQNEGSEPKHIDDVVGSYNDLKSGDLNDDLYNTMHGDFRSMIERRSKRIMKGSKTMSNFHKSGGISKPGPVVATSAMPNISTKATKDITPASVTPMNRETNASAFRKSVNASTGHMKNQAKVGNTHVRTGHSVIAATPKSSAANKSSRVIRTGAFQRMKS
jgi:hypothetical protein